MGEHIQPNTLEEEAVTEQASLISRGIIAISDRYETVRDRAEVATAIGASVFALAVGITVRNAVMNPDPVRASNVPAATPEANANLKQTCVQAGLVMPTIKTAKLLHPGNQQGRTQTAVISAEYAGIPAECSGTYRRLGQAKIQLQDKDHGKKWRAMRSYWRNMYTREAPGIGGLSDSPTGHEDESIYWDKGEKARLVYRNIVKNSDGKIVAQKTKKYPLQIGG